MQLVRNTGIQGSQHWPYCFAGDLDYFSEGDAWYLVDQCDTECTNLCMLTW